MAQFEKFKFILALKLNFKGDGVNFIQIFQKFLKVE